MERPPVTARYVAIAQLAGAVLVAIIGVVGGVLMQVELAAPGPKWSAQFYSRVLTFHDLTPLAIGAAPLAGGLGYLAIVKLVGAKRIPLPALAWVAFGVWVIGIACSIVATLIVTSDTGWTFYVPATLGEARPPALLYLGPLAIGASTVLYAVHLAIVVITHRAQTLQVAIAAVLVIAVGGAGLVGMRGAFDSIQSLDPKAPALALALGLATVAIAGDAKASRVLTLIGVGVAVVWAVFPLFVVGIVLAGIWISLAIMGGFSRPAVAFVVFGCAPALALHGLATGFLSVTVETHLHDTHFVVVGILHVLMALVGFAALAGLHAWSFTRHPKPIVAWIGGCVCSGGLFLHVYSSLAVGGAGMPRRYWDYDPVFTASHTLSLWSTGVLLVGAVMIAVAWFVGKRESSTITSS